MDSDIAISVRNLTKKYKLYNKPIDRLKESLSPFRKKYHKDFTALNDISFDIKKGETIGIIGKNGSGKSTLLKLLTGVLTPSSGSIKAKGKISALLELGAGFNPDFTGIENVYFNGSIMGFSKAEMDSKIDNILEFADIGEFAKQPVKMYSSGMYVRLAFSLAINVDPDILIVDEALAVGDARFQLKCYQKFEDFRKKGKTLIFVSHGMADIVRNCRRAIWINEGFLYEDGDAKKVTEKYISWLFRDTHEGKKTTGDSRKIINYIKPNCDLIPIPEKASISGDGGVIIEGVGVFDNNNQLVDQIKFAQKVKLFIRLRALVDINEPYIGFHIINNKGMIITGCNNHVLKTSFSKIKKDTEVTFSFEFYFPEIENNSYFISIGINDGNPTNHKRLIFIVDAYQFEFNSSNELQKQGVLLKLTDCICNKISKG